VAVGFCDVEVEPFPKSHNHDVGEFEERSWKLTTSGEQPAVVAVVKLAPGTCAFKLVVTIKHSNAVVRFFRIFAVLILNCSTLKNRMI
jgi:hypothetical protein